MSTSGSNILDVIVIGGGPSGLQTATFLSRNGFNVVLLDKRTEIGKDVVCSGVISSEAFERYDLPREAIVGSISKAELCSPNNTKIRYSHPDTAAFVVDRYVFDGKLAERAMDKGAQIRLKSQVVEIIPGADYVECVVRVNDTTEILRSRIAVIATGINLRLQQMLGLGRPKKILQGIQVEAEASDLDSLKIYFGNRISKGFFGWAIPLKNGKARIGLISDGNSNGGFELILKDLRAEANVCTDGCELQKRGITFGAIPKSYTNRVLVVGEAAGQIKTTTGGGIYYGLQGGEIAANTIMEAFEAGDFSEQTLKIYEKHWKGILGKEITIGEYFHSFYSKLNDDSINKLFEAALKDDLLNYLFENGKFDWHRNVVMKIIRSSNLRKVLLREAIAKVVGL